MRQLAVVSAALVTLGLPSCNDAAESSFAWGEAGASPGNGPNDGGSAGTSAQGGAATAAGMNSGGASDAPPAGEPGGTSGGEASCTATTPLEVRVPTACPEAAGSRPADIALALVNELRAQMGLPCMTLDAALESSAQKHCDYFQQNAGDSACVANAHAEVETCPGYVDKSFANRMLLAGYTGSPRSEVMAFGGEPADAVALWINSVYHRTPLLSPWIAEMGYGMTDDCDTIDMGQGPKAADTLTAVYPYPGQLDVPLDFDGSHEGPMPPRPPSGWPSASPIHLYVKGYTVTSHEVFVDGTCEPLPHQWLAEKDDYILYPDEPFARGTEYRVVIQGTKAGAALDFDWSFTTKQ